MLRMIAKVLDGWLLLYLSPNGFINTFHPSFGGIFFLSQSLIGTQSNYKRDLGIFIANLLRNSIIAHYQILNSNKLFFLSRC